MSLSAPRILFGVHAFTPYSRTTKEFYGTVRVLASSSLEVSGELVELTGGSNRYPWDVQDGNISAEMSLNVKEYPDFLFELFLGKAPTPVAPSANGTISALTNGKGTSMVNPTTGLASVALYSGNAANLKFGKYVLKATDADSFDVYVCSDVDFQRGTDVDFVNDALKVTAAPIDMADTSDTQEIAALGLEFTGGSGTIAFVTGDTAYFEVLPAHSGGMEVNIGATSDVFPEFGAIMIAQQKGNGEMFDVEAYRVKAIGLPLGFNEKEFSEAEITAKCFYDSTVNRVLRIRHVKPA